MIQTANFDKYRKQSWHLFLIISFIYYKLFCPISQNKPGRHKESHVIRHILKTLSKSLHQISSLT